jgi:hypothetical protein
MVFLSRQWERAWYLSSGGCSLDTHAMCVCVCLWVWVCTDCWPCQVFLVYTGWDNRLQSNNVGTTSASAATYAAISAFHPDVVLSAGTAGGFGAVGAAIGDVYLSTKTVFHARRIPVGAGSLLEEYSYGHFRSPPLSALAAKVSLQPPRHHPVHIVEFGP